MCILCRSNSDYTARHYSAAPPSGDHTPPTLDLAAIISQLSSSWGGDEEGSRRTWRDGDGTTRDTVTYSIPTTNPGNDTTTDGMNFRNMTAYQRQMVGIAFELWDELIPIELQEVTSATDFDISFAYSAAGNNYCVPTTSGTGPAFDIAEERIWLDANDAIQNEDSDIVYGARSFQRYLHEIGHSLGLSHPGSYDGSANYHDDAEYVQDSRKYTVMSYFDADEAEATADHVDAAGVRHYAATPMLHDIAAIQAKYGADTTTRLGATTYGFNATPGIREAFNFNTNQHPVVAIWDAGGVDTLDVSGFATDQIIELRQGIYSSVADLTQNVVVAFNTVIENAIGGAGNDTIRGNEVSNTLVGGLGRDILEGFDGNDTLDAGAGESEMYGGNHTDYMWAGPQADYIDGGEGYDLVDYSRSTSEIQIDTTIGKVIGGWAFNDTLLNIEYVTATAFNDNIRMGNEDNVVRAGDGADSLDGNGGADYLYGEFGDDTVRGGAGADFVSGGTGWDIASFGSAVTINLQSGAHSGEAAGDTFVSIEQYNGSAEADTMVASNLQGANFAGGDGVDYLYGGDQGDWLQGGKGGDYLSGGNGPDTASYADAPNAIIAEMYFDADTTLGHTEGKITAGDWGLDTLVGVENVEGSAFSDTLYGDERSNTLSGLGGDDRIEGDGGNTPQGSADSLLGGTGNDSILIGAFDSAYGGADFDTATFVGGPINLNFNTVTFTVGGQNIYLREFESYVGTAGNDTIYGAAYGETINFGDGNDVIYAQGGDDFIYAGAGADVMDGGAGRDTVAFHKAMVADWQSGVLDADIGSDSWANWEVIQGSAGNDRIRTNSWGFAVELRGGAGNDVLATGVTGLVADTLLGEDGNDQLDGGAGADRLDGGAGNDTFGLGADTADRVTDASGIDTITSTITRSLGAYAAIENLTLLGSAAVNGAGNVLANVLTGNAAANGLSGGDGNDTLVGGGGRDGLYGGAGNDSYVLYADTTDGISDTSGIDTIASTITRSLVGYGQIENLTLLGSAAINGTGNTLNNLLTGNAAANTLSAGDGNDRLAGAAGRDALFGGRGNDIYELLADTTDTISDYSGIDTITSTVTRSLASYAQIENLTLLGTSAITGIGNGLNNLLTGNAGANRLQAGLGNDVLSGGAGNDLLIGEAGNDNLEGGFGADTLKGVIGADKFVFRQSLVATSGADHISDFGADDFIYFDHPSVTGPLNPVAFVAGANALDANDRFIYYAPYKSLYFDPDGNGAAAKVLFAVFDNGYTPTAADIVLF